MKTYVYPAVLIQNKDGSYYLSIPDLNLLAQGETEKDAFLNGKECVKSYFDLAERFDTIIPPPTDYNTVAKNKKYAKNKVVMIDITVNVNNLELTEDEQEYRDFMKLFFDEN